MKHQLLPTAAILAALALPAHSKPWHEHPGPHGYGYGNCPPGLRDKGCIPPGQAKKMLRRGERYDLGERSRYAYGQIPYSIRRQYDLSGRYQYYYDQGYLYQVDPRTLLVQQAIRALLR